VHDDNKTIDAFGTLTLNHCYAGKDIYIRPLAETCWSEYIAHLMSSPTASETWLKMMAESFGGAVERTKTLIDNEILEYRYHSDLSQLMDVFQRHGAFLAKSAASILGYVDGLNMSLGELSAETSECLSGSYFEPTWIAMHEALQDMRQLYPNDWRDLSIYDGLAVALDRYYAEMGLILSTTDDGQTYVDIPLSPETTP
jgi:hypothetical protein